jgi:hypothetical protein
MTFFAETILAIYLQSAVVSQIEMPGRIGGMERKMNRMLLAPLALTALCSVAKADVITYDAALAPPGVYFGTGNANAGFTVDTANGIEIGLSAINRFSGAINAPGSLYEVPLGDYSGGGSEWGIDFSIDLQVPGGSSTLTLGDIDAVFTATDVNTGFSQSFADFLPAIPDNTCYGPGGAGACGVSTQYGVQNSEPGSLLASLGDTGFNDKLSDTYDISLAVYGCTSTTTCTTNLLASDSIQVQAPEPGTLAIFSTALLGLGYLGKRRGALKFPTGAC